MEKDKLKKIQSLIDNKIKSIDNSAFLDGIINIDKYTNANPKILWILKEPNSDEIGVNWREYIQSMNDNSGNLGGFAKTFTSLIYTSYGIYHSKNWSEINWIRDEPEIVEILEHISFINLKKSPGGSNSSDYIISNSLLNYKSIVIEQIKAYEPNVIIGGNTVKFLEDILKEIYPSLTYDEYISTTDLGVSISKPDNLILFDARHPQNTSTTHEVYCNDIINKYLKLKKTPHNNV